MGTRSYRPGEYAPIIDKTQILDGHAHDISVDQLIPRIEFRSHKAAEVVPLDIHFFRAMGAGRRCSCFDVEVSPDSQCQACFGLGIVGGFEKYGTTVEVIDVTRPSIRTSNIMPDWSSRRKPLPFKLVDGARYGSLEARVRFTTTTGVLDALAADFIKTEGSTISAHIRAPSDQFYVPLTREELKKRLSNPWVDVKIILERQSPAEPSPLLKSVYVRYKNFDNNVLIANVPPTTKSIALQEIGIADEFTQINFWLPATLKAISTEDFFISIEGDTRWKIVTVKPFAPHGQLTSWDVMARLIQDHEPLARIPA